MLRLRAHAQQQLRRAQARRSNELLRGADDARRRLALQRLGLERLHDEVEALGGLREDGGVLSKGKKSAVWTEGKESGGRIRRGIGGQGKATHWSISCARN